MNAKKLLVLLILLAAIVGFFFYDKGRLEQKEEAKEKSKEVFTVKRDDVETVRLERMGEKPVVIAKSAKEGAETTWKITEPVVTTADQSILENLVVTLTGAKKESDKPLSATGEKAADYGLDPVELKLTLKTATQEQMLNLGLLAPNDTQAYARMEGDPAIFLLPKAAYTAANKTLFDLRDKALVNVVNYKVDRIVLADATRHIDLRKQTEDVWKIASAGLPMRAEPSRVTDFMNDLNSAKVAQFVDDATSDLSPYGLVEPATTVEIWEGDQKRTLQFGGFLDAAHTRLYAQVEGRPGILVVENTALKNAPVDMDKLRSKKFFASKSWNADGIEVKSSSPMLALSFSKDASGEWRLSTGESERVLDYSAFAKFFDALDRLKAAGFAAPSSQSAELLATPEWTLVVASSKENMNERIDLGALDNVTESRYARRVETGELMVVYDEDLDELRKECQAIAAPPVSASGEIGSASPLESGDAPDAPEPEPMGTKD